MHEVTFCFWFRMYLNRQSQLKFSPELLLRFISRKFNQKSDLLPHTSHLSVQWGLDYTSYAGSPNRLLRVGLLQWRLWLVLTQGPFGVPNSACLRLNGALSLERPVGTGLHQFYGKSILGSPGGCLLQWRLWMVLTQGPFGAPNSACLRLNGTLSLECPVGTGLHQFSGGP